MKKPPQRDPFSMHQRKVTAERRVGVGAKCVWCGETRPEVLDRDSNPISCFSCQREQRGRTIFDLHHPAGEANSPVRVPIWVNDHVAECSALQHDWPKETLQNPDRSPLLAAAGRTRGYVETNAYLADKLLRQNAELLEALDEYLVKKLGPQWWIGTPLEKLAPKH